MSKKKAIKLATASVLAASSFAAVAPFTTEAATSVTSQVSKATTQMKKAQDTYLAVGETGKVVSAKTVQKEVDLAKKYYDAARAAVIKAGGKSKDKNLAKLTDAKKYYNNAKGYIKALGDAQKVGVAGLEAATIKGDIKTVKAVAGKLSKATAQLKKDVYGGDVEKVLVKKYLTLSPAVNAYFYADKAEFWANKADLATAEKRMETVTKELAKVDANSTVGKAVSAYVKTVQDKIEALKAPKVASVSAINNTTVQVTLGGNFKDKTITAADFKVAVEGSDVQIAKFEAGATAGTYTVTIGAILKDGQSVTVTGADDLTGSATAKYATLQVAKVEAVVATYDSTKTEQKLGLKVNGADTTVEALDADGYEVQFQADKGVFAGGATVSGNGILDKAALTALVAANNKFKYKVVITKDGAIVAESAQVEVNLFDGTKTATAIQGYKLKQTAANGGEVITSSKLVSGDSADVTEIVASGLIDNRQDIDVTRSVTLETSNPFVVSVTQPTAGTDGQITAVGTGTATITIKSGTTTKTFTVTVVNEARKITSVSASESSVKLARGGSKNVTLTFKDQYGDVMAAQDQGTEYTVSTSITNANADQVAAVADPANTSDKGKTDVTVVADGINTGSGTFRVYKPNGTVILSLPVTVEADTIANTFKLEAANADSVDKILDLNDEEITEQNNKDHQIVFNLNQYTAAGSFIGAVGTANLDPDKTDVDAAGVYSIVVVDNKGEETTIAGAGDAAGITIGVNGAITIDTTILTGAVQDYSKVGTYTIKAYNKDNTLVASTTFTVKDSAPVVSAATFVSNFEINTTTASIASLIPDANIKITGAGGDGKVRVDAAGVVYIDTDNSDAGNTTANDIFTQGTDIYLGKIVVAKKSGTIATGTLALDNAGGITTTNGDDGVISVGIQKRGATTPTFVGDFTVKH